MCGEFTHDCTNPWYVRKSGVRTALCRAFVVMNFHSESVDFCVHFFCGFLGAFRPFKRRKENPYEIQSKIHDHACSEKRRQKIHSAGRGACPERGCLNVGARKRQESATFLQRSFLDVAVQFFVCCSTAFCQNDVCAAERQMLQCNFCSATFQELQRNFCFRLSRNPC